MNRLLKAEGLPTALTVFLSLVAVILILMTAMYRQVVVKQALGQDAEGAAMECKEVNDDDGNLYWVR